MTTIEAAVELLTLTKKWLRDHGTVDAACVRIDSAITLIRAHSAFTPVCHMCSKTAVDQCPCCKILVCESCRDIDVSCCDGLLPSALATSGDAHIEALKRECIDPLTPHGGPDYNRGFMDCKMAVTANIDHLAASKAGGK